ncbi:MULTISPECIES: hypothetical protein [Flavobacterium]|uniref:hypothetical protein n=1 Tax=Flavobacterium TaxID=237 RepID=UPI001FCB9C26|nr:MULTISPECIES: hypothetical protein [Flavobacterium]UOK43907.1 hypothetical protein LZF87_07245 [Flavobacterium enshiense]
MKNLILTIFLLISTLTFAQGGALADLKFEDAEAAFNNGDYNLTLKKVDEFEKALGNMTSKSLYLRVVSQDKLFNPGIYNENQYQFYNSLISNVEKYLKSMESEGLDDKFREVYAISEKLNDLNLPKDKAGFEKALKARASQNAALNAENEKFQKQANYVNSLTAKYKFKRDLTLNQFLQYNPDANRLVQTSKFRDPNGKLYSNDGYLNDRSGNPNPEGASTIVLSEGFVNIYGYTIKSGKNIHTEVHSMYQALRQEIINNIDAKYLKQETNFILIEFPGVEANRITVSLQNFSEKFPAYTITFSNKKQ